MVPCNRDFLKALCCTAGPSGCEDAVRDLIRARVTPFCDRIEQDALGNLLCYYEGTSPKTLLLCAHTDEVGMMVTGYTEDGMLTFSCVGGILESVLYGRRVVVGLPDRPICGVICAKPLHLQTRDERGKLPDLRELYIDIGARDRAQAQSIVELGAFATFQSEYVELGAHQIKAKALDDRLGCAILCDLLEQLSSSGVRLPLSVCCAFTVREELGHGSGASVAAHRTDPALAIVLETTAVAHLPKVEPHRQVATLGAGGALSYIDHGTLYARDFIDLALALAKEKGIPIQPKRYLSGANDAAHVHKMRAGVKTIALSAPSRYLHSAACVIDGRDADAMLALVWELICSDRITTLL